MVTALALGRGLVERTLQCKNERVKRAFFADYYSYPRARNHYIVKSGFPQFEEYSHTFRGIPTLLGIYYRMA